MVEVRSAADYRNPALKFTVVRIDCSLAATTFRMTLDFYEWIVFAELI